ncbi:hypothetical protein HUX88_31045 [Duganella sp. BJB1802]|uniref:hypothetical protein n=1 Tax=Duganella sp. BJB1802 TaxID=2744575 RepID=UPI001593FAF4|nr:hypothetical protein [Duganella sp. BJB1802]NVD74921.1 hypothetical protein [Duganella sp. BJB1802]
MSNNPQTENDAAQVNVMNQEYVPSEEATKIFATYKAEAEKRQLSSSENYDKSILTYSSGGLAVSLTFLKDFIPIKQASGAFLLYGSWLFFVIATGVTITSFLVSYKAQENSLLFAQKYYLEGNEEYFNKKSWSDHVTKWFNIISGITFVLALIFTSIFVSINLDKAGTMTEKTTITRGIAQDGIGSPMMTKIQGSNDTLQRGVPTPAMQKIIPPSAPTPAPVTNSTPTQR